MLSEKPELIIVGGANGSGKTTFARPYIKQLGYDFLNADDITKILEEKGYQNALIKAGRIFFAKLHDCMEQKRNFVVETTLSGSYINKVAMRAASEGYTVKIIYLFLDNPDMCVNRVQTRVIKGGHTVPEEAVVRRFFRSKANFWNNFTKIADNWIMIYNGEAGFQQVAIGDKTKHSVENVMLFNLFHSTR